MPFYEILHSTPLSTDQRSTLAQKITTLHSTTFDAPSFFVNVKFSSSSSNDPTVPQYFIAGHPRQHPNVIFAHVRGGGSRTNEVFNKLAEDIEGVWDEVLGVEDQEGDWNDGKRLQGVFIVPGLIARESGFSIPEAGSECHWIENNMPLFKKRALEGDTEMKRLVEELEARSKRSAD